MARPYRHVVLFFVLAIFSMSSMATSLKAKRDNQPNVIVILADDQDLHLSSMDLMGQPTNTTRTTRHLLQETLRVSLTDRSNSLLVLKRSTELQRTTPSLASTLWDAVLALANDAVNCFRHVAQCCPARTSIWTVWKDDKHCFIK